MNTLPSGSVPASSTCTIPSCLMRAIARASIKKRSAICSVAVRCPWRILTATSRPVIE